MQEQYKMGDVVYGVLRGGKHVQDGARPMVIVSNNVGNRHSPVYSVIPFTSKKRKTLLPTQVAFKAGAGGLTRDSILLSEQRCPIDKDDVLYKLGTLSPDEMALVANAMAIEAPVVMLAFVNGIIDSREFHKVSDMA